MFFLKEKRLDINVCIVFCFSKFVDEFLVDINGEKLILYIVININYFMENVMLDLLKVSGKEF